MAFDINLLEGSYAAILAALFGGVGVRLLDKMLSRRSESFNEAMKLRQELRDELESLREDVGVLRADADSWRAKYWEQVEEIVQHLAEIKSLNLTIDELKTQVQELTETLAKLRS